MFIAFVCLGNDQVVVHYFYPLSLSLKLPLVIAFLYFFIIPPILVVAGIGNGSGMYENRVFSI